MFVLTVRRHHLYTFRGWSSLGWLSVECRPTTSVSKLIYNAYNLRQFWRETKWSQKTFSITFSYTCIAKETTVSLHINIICTILCFTLSAVHTEVLFAFANCGVILLFCFFFIMSTALWWLRTIKSSDICTLKLQARFTLCANISVGCRWHQTAGCQHQSNWSSGCLLWYMTVLIGRIAGLARTSVCPSVRVFICLSVPAWAPNSKQKRRRKNWRERSQHRYFYAF